MAERVPRFAGGRGEKRSPPSTVAILSLRRGGGRAGWGKGSGGELVLFQPMIREPAANRPRRTADGSRQTVEGPLNAECWMLNLECRERTGSESQGVTLSTFSNSAFSILHSKV